MGLSRLYPLALGLSGILVAIVLVLPYRSVPFARSDGVEVRVPRLERLDHTSDLWDYLQLGRAFQQGHGLSSRFTYPPFLPESVSRARDGEFERFPLFWRQPGYPILVGVSFMLWGCTDPNAVLALQALAVFLLPLVTYVLARRVLTPGWSALAGLWALLSPVVLGVRSPFVATTWFSVILALLAAGFLTSRRARTLLGLGILVGAAALMRLETWILLPGLLLMGWMVRDGRRGLATLTILIVALFLVTPWYARLASLTGNPVYNASSLLYHDTDAYPGWAASRSLSVRELDPLDFAREHGANLLRKSIRNLARFGRDLFLLPSPALAPFVWLALLRPPRDRRQRALILGGAVSATALIAALAPMQYAPRFLATFVPLLAVAAALTLSRWPGLGRVLAGVATGVGVVYLGAALLARETEGTAALAAGDLNRLMVTEEAAPLHSNAVALSNAPTIYAWIWDRPAVWVPLGSEVRKVRKILPTSIGVFTCSTGRGDRLSRSLIQEYRDAGGVPLTPGCATLIIWPDRPGEGGS